MLIELANNVVEPLNLPDWTPRLVIILALIGFPIMLVLSWIFDITPEGLSKTADLEEEKENVNASFPSEEKLESKRFDHWSAGHCGGYPALPKALWNTQSECNDHACERSK